MISFFLLAVLKHKEVSSLRTYFKSSRLIKLQKFNEAKVGKSLKDQELLELWESMLTGRSAPLSRWMKNRYQVLGLNHIFTPSGFHLSAVLWPLMKVFQTSRTQFIILALVSCGILFLPGFMALKRMLLIKVQQKIFGLKTGFALALVIDVLFGNFQESPLSFSYSFLFLGIIYSGVKGIGLVFWFFIAQMILALFQGNLVSPLLILVSPILNFIFAIMMPALFILAIPLASWQVLWGLKILTFLQYCVDLSAQVVNYIPFWEIHFGMLILTSLFLFKHFKIFLLLMLFLSNSLNLDLNKAPGLTSYEFKPQGSIIKFVSKTESDLIYYSDGKCERKLIRGFWWEKCSPKKRSTYRKKIKKLLHL